MMLYVFFNVYRTDTTHSRTRYPINNTLVCINPDTTLYVFFNVYMFRFTNIQTHKHTIAVFHCPTNQMFNTQKHKQTYAYT